MRLLPLLVFILTGFNLMSQTSSVKGKISDLKTGEPITGASVYFEGTGDMTTSNFEGQFTLKSVTGDTLIITYVGYETQKIYVARGASLTLNIKMVNKDVVFSGAKASSKVNRALKIIENAQNNKQNYNFEQLNSFECESFTKIQIAVNNVSEDLKNKKLLKSVEGIFDTMSYLSEDKGKQVLPIFISENLSNFYYNKNPRLNKEVIIASRVKGIGVEDGSFLSQLLGSTFQQYNFNDNILPILQKNFISPISKSSFTYYNFKMAGSDFVPGTNRKIFQIEVTPKNPLDLVFTGYIWIEDSTFALTRLTLSITNKANLNFVEKLKITQELQKTAAGAYVPVKSRILIEDRKSVV